MKQISLAFVLFLSCAAFAHEVTFDIYEYAQSIENLPNGDIVAIIPKVPNIKYISADSELTPVCNVLFRFKSAVEASIGIPHAFNDLYRVDRDGNMFLVKQEVGSNGQPKFQRLERLVCTNRH